MKILIVPEIRGCSRCDGVHGETLFLPLKNPITRGGKVTHTHWAPCPKLGEPILLVCVADHDADPDQPAGEGFSLEIPDDVINEGT